MVNNYTLTNIKKLLIEYKKKLIFKKGTAFAYFRKVFMKGKRAYATSHYARMYHR